MNNDIEKMLKNLPVPELSRDFTRKVMARLPEVKKAKSSWVWQAVLAALLVIALVVVYANLNLGAEKNILDFMMLKAYLIIKSVFLLIKSLLFSKGMLVLYKVILHMGKNFTHSAYFHSAARMILCEAVVLFGIFLLWNRPRHADQNLKNHGAGRKA